MRASFWCALAAQVVFASGLAVCVATVPSYVLGEIEGGVSNYGSDRRTVVPFTVSFGGNAALIGGAAGAVSTMSSYRNLKTLCLSVLAFLLSSVLVSAWVYKRGPRLRTLHFGCGIVLLGFEAAFGLWLAISVRPAWFTWTLWAVVIAADVLCVLALERVYQKLFVGQVMANVAFGVLLLIALA
ncbi:MAG TPA: hypothetical protein VHC43_05375 [Mycobacteriales bacterium]|nr:hypothetical protein [Mycobacteriales bacterium]